MLKKINIEAYTIPLALLAAHLLAFGLLLPFWGYYQDDWHFVYYAYAGGARGLWELFNYDGHPLEAWYYILSFNLLGFKPLGWQLTSLLWRWLTSVAVWAALRELWPARKQAAFAAALLFAIYPLFSLQPLAVSYVGAWLSYFLLCLTFYLMLKAIRTPEKFGLYTSLAVLIKVLHLFTSEYFSGLELARPLLIWLALLPAQTTRRETAWKTLKIWTPYLLPTLAFILWRIFIYQPPIAGHNDATLVTSLLADPLGTIQFTLVHTLPDLFHILFASWANIFSPYYFELSSPARLTTFALMIGGGAAAFAFLSRLKPDEAEAHPHWTRQALGLGVLSILLGMLPAYAADYFITLENPPWNSRFGMAATFGAAVAIAALLDLLISSPRYRNLALAALFGLSLAWHVDLGNAFRRGWDKQARFYEQLTWRAPALAPQTAILSEQEILPIMGDYPTAFAINAIYARPSSLEKRIPYWYFPILGNLDRHMEDLAQGEPLRANKFSVRFVTSGTRNLLVSYEPEIGQCLWLLRPQDAGADYVAFLERRSLRIVSLEQISTDAPPDTLMRAVFGEGQTQKWCYHFQKADLARQFLDWERVAAEWAEASLLGLAPRSPYEYLPFIEAHARLDDWQTASSLTRSAFQMDKGAASSLCSLWTALETETAPSSQREAAVSEIQSALSCTP